MPPFDLDCNDSDFRAHLSEEQLARLERRQSPAPRAVQPPSSLAAAVDRLSSGASNDVPTHAACDGDADGMVANLVERPEHLGSLSPHRADRS